MTQMSHAPVEPSPEPSVTDAFCRVRGGLNVEKKLNV